MGCGATSGERTLRLSRCQRCGHMVDPHLTKKQCNTHVGGVADVKDNMKQECTKCHKKYALEEKYEHGCTPCTHIFDEDMTKLIAKRNTALGISTPKINNLVV